MKKFLSILLALMLVMTSAVWAAPTIQTVETAQEVIEVLEASQEKAKLSSTTPAPKSLKPGLNMVTGTTELLDAEGENASFSDITDVFQIVSGNASTGAVVLNPNKNGNSSNHTYAFSANLYTEGSDYFYPRLHMDFNPDIPRREIYMTCKVAKVNNGSYTTVDQSWLISDGDILKSFSTVPNGNWVYITEQHELGGSGKDYDNTATINGITIQVSSSKANTTPTTILVDDIGIFPAYKITYMNSTGDKVLYSEYVLFDDNGNILETLDVTSKVIDNKFYESWSDSVGGTAIDSYALENEDVVLYALSDGAEVEFTGVSAGKTELSNIGDETELTADFVGNINVNTDLKWSVTGDAIELSSTTGGKITATAVGFGESTVSVTYGETITKSIVIKVADAFDMTSTSTYVTGDSEAVLSLASKNDYALDNNIDWTLTDEDGVAELTINNDGTATVKSSQNGSGVVYVTATLKSNKEKTKTIELYVTSENDASTTVVKGTASASEITTDAGVLTIAAKSYSKVSPASFDVTYSINDTSLAKLSNNSDGSITVEAIKNGTLIVTVTSVYDPTATATFAIEISEQREKFLKYDFRYIALGNSYLDHGASEGWPWADPENGSRGMAASRADLDYFNRTKWYLTHNENYVATITAEKVGGPAWESSLTTDLVKDILDDATLSDSEKEERIIARATATAKTGGSNFIATIQNKFKTFKPNILTIQLAENVRCMNQTALEAAYDVLYGAIAESVPDDCIVVVISHYVASDVRTIVPMKMAKKYGFLVNDMTFIEGYSATSKYNNPYLAYSQYPDSPRIEAIGGHPSDIGMDAIGKGNAEQINSVLSSKIASEYIYLPKELTINGPDAITAENGTDYYTTSANPADAETDVIWSVDDENIAYITDAGILTAVNNGTVEITATSAYDNSVIATKTVTITGQTPCYTLSYEAGAEDDSIAGIPESFAYAKGEMVLSTDVPTRNGYKFAGWSLTKDGLPVATATITANTAVYATWEYAYEWSFDTDGNYESIGHAGMFNSSVKDGLFTGMPYEGTCSIYFNTLLLDSSLYNDIKVKILVSSSEANQKLNVIIKTTDGNIKYSADILDAQMHEYTFNLADATGTITGFEIVPSVMNATVSVDEIEFVRVPGADYLNVNQANTIIDANDTVYLIGNLNIAEGASVILKNGVFDIDEITGATDKITLEDANLITATNFEGYALINLAERASTGNTRYVQINGLTYEINERDNKLGLICDKETIVTVTEKNDKTFISAAYYCINDGVATEINSFANGFYTMSGAQMRVDEPTGIRFRAGITHTARDAADEYKVVEYGFIVAREDQLKETGSQLNFDFSNIVSGAAYLKNDSDVITKDYVFENLDDTIVFTGLLTNIAKQYYTSVLSARPYMKIKTKNDVHIVYGDVISRSIFDVAYAVLKDDNNGLSEEELKVVQSIVDSSLPDDESFIDIEDILKDLTGEVSVLNNKSAIFFGDSVAYGYSTGGNGFGYYADLLVDFGTFKNAARNSATLNTVTLPDNTVIGQIENNKITQYDYVILQGGYGDLRDVPALGTLTDGYDVSQLDTSTFAGAAEYTLYLATKYWGTSKIGFVISYDAPNSASGIRSDYEKTKQYWDMLKAACEKWNVEYLDLFEGSAVVNGEEVTYSELFDVHGYTYIADDKIHPTAKGYERIVPFIVDWMETLSTYERDFTVVE